MVVGRREKEKAKKLKKEAQQMLLLQQQQQQKQRTNENKGKSGSIRTPRRAAVPLIMVPGSKRAYEEVLTTARRRNVQLTEIGVESLKIRPSIAGGFLFEVPGKESAARADELVDKLRRIFPDGGDVRMSRPVKRSELRISGLDVSIRPREVIEAIAAEGGCSESDVKTGEIKRRTPRGASSLWIQCPTTAAKKIMEKGRLTGGWVAARVEALAARPLLCFRCLERGHTIRNCTSEVDRSNRCYNCGSTNHRASACSAPARCPVCADLGRPADHRLGSKACTSPTPKERVGVPEGVKEGAQDHLAESQGDPLLQQPGEETTQQPPSQNECGHEETMEVTV